MSFLRLKLLAEDNTTAGNTTQYPFPFYENAAIPIHSVQFGLTTLLVIVTVPLLAVRHKFQPLKAFSPGVQMLYVIFGYLLTTYLNTFVLTGTPGKYPCWLDMLLQISLAYLYLVCCSGRVFSIYFSFLSVFTKLRMTTADETPFLALQKKVKIYEFLASAKGVLLYQAFWASLFVIQFVVIIPVMIIPDYDTSRPAKGCNFYADGNLEEMAIAYIPTIVFVFVHAAVMALFTLLLICLKVRDNYGVMLGIIHTEIMLILGTVYFAVMSLTESMEPNVHWVNYNIMHSVNLYVIGIPIDIFVNVTIPAIRTFFWEKYAERKSYKKLPAEEAAKAMQQVEFFLTDKEAKKIFTEYATRELAVENIMFYEHVIEFERALPEQRKAMAKQIYQKFIDPSGVMALNITHDIIKGIDDEMKAEVPSIETFKRCKQYAKQNCIDTFMRFKKTNIFIRFTKIKTELVQDQGELAVTIG